MHNSHTTNRMIDAFLSRKAEEYPEVFRDDTLFGAKKHRTPRLLDIVITQ